MPRKTIITPFSAGMGQGPSTGAMDVQVVNMIHVPTPSARSEIALCDIPGSESLREYTPTVGSGGRGAWTSSVGPNGVPGVYWVVGGDLFRRVGTNTVKVGSIISSNKQITFCESQDQTDSVFGYVCDGYSIYSWELKASNSTVASTFQEMEMPFIPGSSTVRGVASYITYNTYRLIATLSNSNQWFYSSLNGNDFSALAFYSSEASPDNTVRVQSFAGNLWVFSRYTCEVRGYTGSSTDPFNVSNSGISKIGICSGDSLAVSGDSMLWLGQEKDAPAGVYMATPSGGIQRVSSPTGAGIDNIIAEWSGKDTAIGFSLFIRGMRLYVLTSRDDATTLVYNITANKWTRFSSGNTGSLSFWNVSCATSDGNGNILFMPFDSGKECAFTESSRIDHDGLPIHRYYQSPVFIANLQRFSLCQIDLDMDVGQSFSSEQGVIYVMPSWNGGKTFVMRTMVRTGKIGEYEHKASAFGLGSGSALVLRFGTSSNAPFIMYQAKLIVDGAA